MEVIAAVVAWGLSFTCQHVSLGGGLDLLCGPNYNLTQLSTRLSTNAQIYYPESEGYFRATRRWSFYEAPKVNVVVVASTENDVAETVKYANEKNMPFIAINSGHGAIKSLGKMEGGIQILLNQLNSIDIAADGKTATFGGGVTGKAVIDKLWEANKQTVTGMCECVSILGPGLGGGHGLLQGHYGLVSDQFVSMNVVLADGSMQTIDETSDLWWAMQGAGHNFGIVTSLTSKIYDVPPGGWAYETYIFTGDSLIDVFETVNAVLLKDDAQPEGFLNYAVLLNIPSIDPVKPVLLFHLLQEGVSEVDQRFTAPFRKMEPLETKNGAGTYVDVPSWIESDLKSVNCKKGAMSTMRFPVDIESYDLAALKKVYDRFTSIMQETPALSNSVFLIEGYSTQGVRKVPRDSTAFPFRDDILLLSPLLMYVPDGPELDRKADRAGEELRQILHEASGRTSLHAYVNYASGAETGAMIYGEEKWRQDRLLALKQKYDPHRKFNFYAPIN